MARPKKQKAKQSSRVRSRRGLIDTFLCCENVRDEVGNKRSVMGIVGTEINIDKHAIPQDVDKDSSSGDPLIAIPLMFFIRVWAKPGRQEVRLRCTKPNGKQHFDMKYDVNVAPSKTTEESLITLVVESEDKRFPVAGFGEYKVTVTVDNQRDSRSFFVLSEN